MTYELCRKSLEHMNIDFITTGIENESAIFDEIVCISKEDVSNDCNINNADKPNSKDDDTLF